MFSRLKNEYFSQLCGYCLEKNKRILVFQYATMGCLHEILHVKIAYGAARGLQYLHEKAQPPIVILSNLSSDNAARLHSTRVLGTFGYHAPEYVMTGQITQKSDVYSFGVILLELLTRRKPMDHTLLKGQQSLITWALCYDGIQRLLGISQTVGTVPDALPLPISTLLSTFTLTHNPDV
ncbi:putative protein kinase RLK-Pelle-RLCK-VIII family [Helianthus annuus]|uniref:Protein kinase domain-containing protein n=1 Tax=Helianthus annuus TaxID=4232 RepID=A0A9K3E8S1_HELAN|nr:putative protein kinase RLK-Pelle-RLCK-VIII family [Helianthus annuus]